MECVRVFPKLSPADDWLSSLQKIVFHYYTVNAPVNG